MLTYLNEAVEKKLAGECSTPTSETALTPFSKNGATPVNLSGFELPPELVAAERARVARAKALERLKVYRDDALSLTRFLARAGVEPIAVITAKVFDKLVDEMGLFKLAPSRGGKVIVRQPMEDLALNTAWQPFLHMGTAALTLVGFMTAFHYWGWELDAKQAPMSVVFAVAAAFLTVVSVNVAVGVGYSAVERAILVRRAKAWLAGKTWAEILTGLTDDGKRGFIAPTWDQDNNTQRTVVLPPPPPSIVNLVCRIAGARTKEDSYDLRVAAEADAISFKEGLAGLFDDEAAKSLQAARAKARHDAWFDPILYIRGCKGGAVAIVGQYGELALEKELIDRVVNSEHLL